MGYYSTSKKRGGGRKAWHTLQHNEDIVLKGTSLSQKDKYSTILLIGGNRKTQVPRDRKWNGGGQGLWEEGKREPFSGCGVSGLQHVKFCGWLVVSGSTIL